MKYISLLMNYIEQEYDNIPESVTPEIEDYFLECANRGELIPNAAGMFHELFMKAKT
jgi:hypothetical protein